MLDVNFCRFAGSTLFVVESAPVVVVGVIEVMLNFVGSCYDCLERALSSQSVFEQVAGSAL